MQIDARCDTERQFLLYRCRVVVPEPRHASEQGETRTLQSCLRAAQAYIVGHAVVSAWASGPLRYRWLGAPYGPTCGVHAVAGPVACRGRLLPGSGNESRSGKGVAGIESLGGGVSIDKTIPDKPVVGVGLGYTRVTDAALVHLERLTDLQLLDLTATG